MCPLIKSCFYDLIKCFFLKCTAEDIKRSKGKRDFNLANIIGREICLENASLSHGSRSWWQDAPGDTLQLSWAGSVQVTAEGSEHTEELWAGRGQRTKLYFILHVQTVPAGEGQGASPSPGMDRHPKPQAVLPQFPWLVLHKPAHPLCEGKHGLGVVVALTNTWTKVGEVASAWRENLPIKKKGFAGGIVFM